jgi:hypothetical protein
MRIWHQDDRDLAFGTSTPPRQPTGNVTGMCPRLHRRSQNPALPPPGSPTCLARGPDCCVTSAVVDVRRAA